MKYYVKNNMHIVEVPTKDFKIIMNDSAKKSAKSKNFCNAGFFAGYRENLSYFTLPTNSLKCDYEATNQYTKKYCFERGKFVGGKYTFKTGAHTPQFKNKSVSTLIVRGEKASIEDVVYIPDEATYAIGGVPIMRNGADVKFNTYVRSQGWDASTLYATWHIFAGVKQDGKTIYIIGMKTTSGNMILSAEAYNKFKSLGLYDVIKLDGGGSFILNINGSNVASTSENRRVNTIITFGNMDKSANPYQMPSVAIYYGVKNIEGVKWLQWELNRLGYKCSIDGSFGLDTKAKLKQFQKDYGLVVDGSCGNATKAKINSIK